ncbi:hypothetical protein RE428_49280 (plasmid) [Marinobacter nanhaiticus D15-8W]|uniref:Uncharacterized protein n=1 Tax=Marinobacter nanhaiticus D15-8W TaxID=626887 RepID=N6WA32_9GAMM|nr:hypothetical protein [Marinobacter nanhaiticus]ENO17104.1 hypothetical protein J057_00524 [Marinobacter nanhaiticus D15-8W]BES73910.1 hypothetical protein RE428_49280 [Marinobacter nanhaiticus D15-8W]
MHDQDRLNQVFAYRTFDFRNRFPDPLPSFRAALECLQSEVAYLPDVDAEIVAYLKDGRAIPMPDAFFWQRKPRFASRAEAQEWVLERQTKIEQGGEIGQLVNTNIADPRDTLEKQIEDALNSTATQVIPSALNDETCRAAERWLRAAIDALPPVDLCR